MTVFDFIQDYDNDELDGFDMIEQMEDAVRSFNEQYGTDHNPRTTVQQYLREKKTKKYEE